MDPRALPAGGYSTVPVQEESEAHSRRLRVKDVVTDPNAKSCLFAAATVRGQMCHGFAALSVITSIEKTDGPRYNLVTKLPDESRLSIGQDWRAAEIWPRDVVEFAINNAESPLTIVTCDLHAGNDAFLAEFCYPTDSTETDDKDVCGACHPTTRRRATFITDDGLFLYCQDHARTMLQYRAGLLVYKPTIVTLSINDSRIWLSTVESLSVGGGDCCHLTYRDLPRSDCYWFKPQVFDEGTLLVRCARDWGWNDCRSSDDPLSIAKAMQFLCVKLLARRQLCSRTEEMGRESILKVRRT